MVAGSRPIGERGGNDGFQPGNWRFGIAQPAEVAADESHEVPRAAALDGLTVGKNGGERGHAAPDAKKQKLESNEQNYKEYRSDQVKGVDGQNIPEASDGNGLAVENEPQVGGGGDAQSEQTRKP